MKRRIMCISLDCSQFDGIMFKHILSGNATPSVAFAEALFEMLFYLFLKYFWFLHHEWGVVHARYVFGGCQMMQIFRQGIKLHFRQLLFVLFGLLCLCLTKF